MARTSPRRGRATRWMLPALLWLLSQGAAQAADLKVLTAGAFKPVLLQLAPAFERDTGHKLSIDNDTAGALARRIAAGEAFDLVVLPPAALQPLAERGQIKPASIRPLAKVGIGLAVKQGAPRPPLGNLADFKAALLAARAVAYIDPAAGGSSGIYLSGLFEQLGIATQIRDKAVLVPGGLVAKRLVSGEADLALHQISEILAVPGAELVGPLPDEIQNWTVYAGALASTGREPAAAQALLDLLRGPAATELLRAKGMSSP
jgi:molybdate transport system substrate-binding protein